MITVRQIDNRQKQKKQLKSEKNPFAGKKKIPLKNARKYFRKKDHVEHSSVINEEIEQSGKHVEDEESKTVGRNDLCPCGSGKKYKKCCLEKEKKSS